MVLKEGSQSKRIDVVFVHNANCMYVYKYSDIYLLCIGLSSVLIVCKNVITMGKLIGLLLFFCLSLLSI